MRNFFPTLNFQEKKFGLSFGHLKIYFFFFITDEGIFFNFIFSAFVFLGGPEDFFIHVKKKQSFSIFPLIFSYFQVKIILCLFLMVFYVPNFKEVVFFPHFFFLWQYRLGFMFKFNFLIPLLLAQKFSFFCAIAGEFDISPFPPFSLLGVWGPRGGFFFLLFYKNFFFKRFLYTTPGGFPQPPLKKRNLIKTYNFFFYFFPVFCFTPLIGFHFYFQSWSFSIFFSTPPRGGIPKLFPQNLKTQVVFNKGLPF